MKILQVLTFTLLASVIAMACAFAQGAVSVGGPSAPSVPSFQTPGTTTGGAGYGPGGYSPGAYSKGGYGAGAYGPGAYGPGAYKVAPVTQGSLGITSAPTGGAGAPVPPKP